MCFQVPPGIFSSSHPTCGINQLHPWAPTVWQVNGSHNLALSSTDYDGQMFLWKTNPCSGFFFFDRLTATGIHFWFLWTIPSHIVLVLILGLAWQVKQCKTKPIISSLMEWRCITSNHLLVKHLRTCLQQTDLQCFNVQTGRNPDKCLIPRWPLSHCWFFYSTNDITHIK